MTDSTTLHILGTIIIQELGIRIPTTQGNKHPQQLTQAPLQDDSVLMDLGMAARLDRGDLVTWCFPVARLRGVYGGEKQGISTCNNWSGSRWGINLSWEYQMRWNKMWFLETRGPPRWKPHGENIGLLILETPTPSPVRLRYCWVILSHTVSKLVDSWILVAPCYFNPCYLRDAYPKCIWVFVEATTTKGQSFKHAQKIAACLCVIIYVHELMISILTTVFFPSSRHRHRCPFPIGWLINRGVSLPL